MGRQVQFGEDGYLERFFSRMCDITEGTELFVGWDGDDCVFLRDKCGEGLNIHAVYRKDVAQVEEMVEMVDVLVGVDWIGRSMSAFLPESVDG
jgi:hypothetical protein